MLDKKMLVVIKPCPDKSGGEPLPTNLGVFSSGGYECTGLSLKKRGDATEFRETACTM